MKKSRIIIIDLHVAITSSSKHIMWQSLLFNLVNMFMFTSDNYCVKETDRIVTVCVKKSRVTEYNLDIDISAIESSPPSALSQ